VEKEDCIQFLFKGKICKTSKVVWFGRKPAQGSEKTMSGWLLDRVDEWVKRLDGACNGEEWVLP
jgi:hypothetical protein